MLPCQFEYVNTVEGAWNFHMFLKIGSFQSSILDMYHPSKINAYNALSLKEYLPCLDDDGKEIVEFNN